MNHYFLKRSCKELHPFPPIVESSLKKFSTIQLDFLKEETVEFFRFYYVMESRFIWKTEINIRISEAIKLLKRPDMQVTSVALDVGFYSSQHLATTFKKLTV